MAKMAQLASPKMRLYNILECVTKQVATQQIKHYNDAKECRIIVVNVGTSIKCPLVAAASRHRRRAAAAAPAPAATLRVFLGAAVVVRAINHSTQLHIRGIKYRKTAAVFVSDQLARVFVRVRKCVCVHDNCPLCIT